MMRRGEIAARAFVRHEAEILFPNAKGRRDDLSAEKKRQEYVDENWWTEWLRDSPLRNHAPPEKVIYPLHLAVTRIAHGHPLGSPWPGSRSQKLAQAACIVLDIKW